MRLQFGDCVFDSDAREVRRRGRGVALTPKGFQLLDLLVQRRPDAVSKQDIQNALWPDIFVSEANVPNLVADVRAALGDDGRCPRIIRTVQRFGYAFQADSTLVAREPDAVRHSECRLIWRERELFLQLGDNTVGRDDSARVWIDAHGVSRFHARIHITADTATIEDLGSKNGTFVRACRISAPVALQDGDDIRLGNVELLFRRGHRSEATVTVHADTPDGRPRS